MKDHDRAMEGTLRTQLLPPPSAGSRRERRRRRVESLIVALTILGGCEPPAHDSAPRPESHALTPTPPQPGAVLTIDFDTDPTGAPLPRGSVLGEQFAAWGLHFENGYVVGDRAFDFPDYVAADSGNRVCTPEGSVMPQFPVTWTPGRCAGSPAWGTPLVIDFDFPVCFASIQGTTVAALDNGFGKLSVFGRNGDGATIASKTSDAFVNTIRCVGCSPFISEGTNGVGVFLPPGTPIGNSQTTIEKVVVNEIALGSLDKLTVQRCEALFAACGSPTVCAAQGQCSSGTAAIDINAGSSAADRGPITLSQSKTNDFPLGSTTVSLTVTEGDLIRTCEGTVTIRDCEPPMVTCPPPATIECDPTSGPDSPPGGCTSYTAVPATAVDACGPTTVTPLATCAALGTIELQQTAFDEPENLATCSSTLTVVDTQPPIVTSAPGPARELGPVDNQLHTVTLADCGVQITDHCMRDIATRGTKITCVTSDEEEGHSPDIVILDADAQLLQLRASRDAAGDGRVYTIHFTATDGGGNSTPGTCQLTVPRLRHIPAVDSGPRRPVCTSWCGVSGGLPCEFQAVLLSGPAEGGVAYAVNARGQVVGATVVADSNGEARGVMWQNGTTVDLGTLGGEGGCTPTAINDRGHVTGYGMTADGRLAPFLWADGVIHELAGIPSGQAFGINDHDQIVGVAYDGGDVSGFLFDHGHVTVIGSSQDQAVGYGVNNSGQVVGVFDHDGAGQAFLWDHGMIHSLPDAYGIASSAYAINEDGQIVGSTFDGNVDNAVMWRHGLMVDLGVSTLWGTAINSTAVAINHRGEIVGSTNPPDGHPHAFHYYKGDLTNLNSTTRLDDFPFNEATGISDDGDVVGGEFADGVPSHAVVWRKH